MKQVCGLECQEQGSGDAVLFIHGAIVADAFAPLMREPALANYRLVRYRRRGYGASAVPDAPTIEGHARDAVGILEGLAIGPAHVVAHSGGGPIAVQLAVDAPEVVRSLVLLEPVLQTAAMAAGFDKLVAPLVEMHHRGESTRAVHIWMRSAAGGSWRAEIEQRIPGAGEMAEAAAAAAFEGDIRAIRTWDFDTVGGRVHQPVLNIVGSVSAPAVERVTAMVRDAWPTSEVAIIEGANHSLQMTHPSAVAEVIATFLARQRQAIGTEVR